jgi:imidazolonepropionase-like amidohydrolase
MPCEFQAWLLRKSCRHASTHTVERYLTGTRCFALRSSGEPPAAESQSARPSRAGGRSATARARENFGQAGTSNAVMRNASARLVASCLVSFVVAVGVSARQTPDAVVVVSGGVVYPAPQSPPISDAVVVIRNGAIASVGVRGSVQIPAGATVIDATGLTVTAGFWNSHVHFLQRKWANAAAMPARDLERQLQDMLTRFGFTTVFDTWSAWENTRVIRDRVESGEVRGPKMLSTGEAIYGQGGEVAEATWGMLGFMNRQLFRMSRVATADDATTAARRLLDAGTDGIKVYAATPGSQPTIVPEAAIAAAVVETHRRGKIAFAHPSSLTGLMSSVRAGVDVLTHTTPQSGPWDEATVREMKAARVALIPTLKLWAYETRHESITLTDRFVDTAVGQLSAWHQAGGTTLFGTDKFRLLARAGLTYRDILTTLTTAPAERFAAADRVGQIKVGLRGDLVLLEGDPARDVQAFTRVRSVLRDGRVIYEARR